MAMTVKDLIEALEKIEDKSLSIRADNSGLKLEDIIVEPIDFSDEMVVWLKFESTY